jgi:hypothetical protein
MPDREKPLVHDGEMGDSCHKKNKAALPVNGI